MVDCAKEVCCSCAKRGFPNQDMPLAGPNTAANYVHVRDTGNGHQVTLCAASSIWCLMRWEWGSEEVETLSPRGWTNEIPGDTVWPGPTKDRRHVRS